MWTEWHYRSPNQMNTRTEWRCVSTLVVYKVARITTVRSTNTITAFVWQRFAQSAATFRTSLPLYKMATAQNFNAKPPEPLKVVTDAVSNWKPWKQLWQNYAIVADIQSESRSPEFIKPLFITTMGIEGLQIYNVCDPEDTDTVNEIILKLDEHILGQTNEKCERYKFNARRQMCEEVIDAYVAALKILQKTCTFYDCLKDSLLRDRIVLGVRDNGVRKRLLQERSLDLSRCIDICRTQKIPPLKWNWSLTQVKKCTEWRNVDTSLIHGNTAEASLDNISKKGRPFQHQHATLVIANSADVNMNGKRKCVQHGDTFAAKTSAIISHGVALQMSVQKCISSTNNRQTLSMECTKIASWRCIPTNRSVMYQHDTSTRRWCSLTKQTPNCRWTTANVIIISKTCRHQQCNKFYRYA